MLETWSTRPGLLDRDAVALSTEMRYRAKHAKRLGITVPPRKGV